MKNTLKKLIMLAIVGASASNAMASTVTLINNSEKSDSHGPLIVFRGFDAKKGTGKVEYLINPTPANYALKPDEKFSAYSTFHLMSTTLGNALIAPYAINVGKQTLAGGKQVFEVNIAGRKNKTLIGPMRCATDSKQECYELPSNSVKATINGKTYPVIINSGKIDLPANGNYKVSLEINVTVKEISKAQLAALESQTTVASSSQADL